MARCFWLLRIFLPSTSDSGSEDGGDAVIRIGAHLRSHRRAVIFQVSLFYIPCFCLMTVWPQSLPDRKIHPQPEPVLLTLTQSVQNEIEPNEEHIYRLDLKAKQYLRLQIEALEKPINVTLATPNGRRLREITCRYSDTCSISALTITPGVRQISVRSVEKNVQSGMYRITFAELRPSISQDSGRILAENSELKADSLSEIWETRGRREAIQQYQFAFSLWERLGDRARMIRALRGAGAVSVVPKFEGRS